MKKLKFYIVFNLFVLSFTVHAQEPNGSLADDYAISITASYMDKVTVFGIIDKSNDNEKAVFIDKGLSPLLQIATTDLVNNANNNWHIIIEAGYTDFEVAKQQNETDNDVDLGTSIEGKYYYVMPVIYYARASGRQDGFKVGIGAGLTKLEANGTAIYNKTADKTTVHSITVDDTGFIFSGFVSYQWSGFHLGFRITGAGFEGGDDSNSDNKHALGEAGLELGYSLYF